MVFRAWDKWMANLFWAAPSTVSAMEEQLYRNSVVVQGEIRILTYTSIRETTHPPWMMSKLFTMSIL